MPIQIENYIHVNNSWPSLREYVLAHFPAIQPGEDPDTAVLQYIQAKAKKALIGGNNENQNLYQSFDRTIRNYKNNRFTSIEKTNLYKLLFTLGLHDIPGILSFCRDTLHQNELSAHSLDDFLVLVCLKLQLSYGEYLVLQARYKDEILAMHHVPKTVKKGVTGQFLDKIIHEINSIDELDKFIAEHLNEFAHTRNTPYLMLFDEVDWEIWEGEDWHFFFEHNPKYAPPDYRNFTDADWEKYASETSGISNELLQQIIIYSTTDRNYGEREQDPKFIEQQFLSIRDNREKLRKDSESLSLKDYYMHRFTIWEYGLSEEQINTLAKDKGYSNAFLSYDTYKALFRRKRNVEIPSGVFLISFSQKYFDRLSREDLERYGADYDYYTACKGFLDECDYMLKVGGFSSLNPYNPFDKLFIDTYYAVRGETHEENIIAFKGLFFERLCSYLKQIADMLSDLAGDQAD